MSEPPLQHLFHPANADAYAAAIRTGLDRLTAELRAARRPATGASPTAAAAPVAAIDLDRPLGDTGEALEEISRLWLRDAVWFHEPAYAAHLNCPVVIPALVAELFLTAVNSSLDTFDQSVGATFMERRLIDWTAGRIGFGPDADGVFTSGGSQSNLQALFLARSRGQEHGIEVGAMRILASRDAHFSVQKSARILGLGEESVVSVPVDRRRRMDPVALERALAACLARGERPVAVVATAGTTDFGAIDPLREIAAHCRTYDAWLHVDAAYGGGLLVSPTRAHLLAGIDAADSVTVDYHKTFFQPVSSSALIVRDGATLAPATWHADYLNPADSRNPDQVGKSLQTTRRFDALKLWLTLRVMGPDVVGAYVDDVIELTEAVHDALLEADELAIAAPPQLSTLVLRYAPAGLSEAETGALNVAIRDALYASGEAMVAATRVDGRQYLKLTLLNPMASREEVLGVVERIVATGRELAGGLAGDRALTAVGGAR